MRRITMPLLVIALAVLGAVPALGDNSKNFTAHLTGDNEVPVVETQGQGQAILQIDGNTARFKLNGSNTTSDILAAHIHLGASDENGPVVVFLYGGPATSGNGRLSSGTFTAADFIGPLAGGTMQDLVDAIESGNAYVNVHTDVNPGGEIRGQL